ncbi:MAG: hypothetical protein M3008_04750 [Chloroflexota bacterium]|nr:hypothetical protein [Chloroflexota bacterium]
MTAQGARAFASAAFAQQWQAGEAIAPNAWGPLATAHDGQLEPYVEASGSPPCPPNRPGPCSQAEAQGRRLVQYFDKARMEQSRSGGPVTNGLLAMELISGRMQRGDTTFDQRTPAAIAVAGDPDNPGPTYAQIRANTASLLDPAGAAIGDPTTRALSAEGTLRTLPAGGSDAQAAIAAYDGNTQHNLPAAFAAYRNRVGLATIGLAISEPFWSNVRVAGIARDVLVQAFERRVLTYTPANPAPFQVEMGNIGQHYYRWRYPGSGALAVATS